MKEFIASRVKIQDAFWAPRLLENAQKAIFHQWRQLEETHCIDNFRIAAGQKSGFREGWFFSDSDAYKWLEAASRSYASWPAESLKILIDDFIKLLNHTQMEDGYIYTYNQIHFPGERWGNLMIEHELYCHGHLIEAGVSHFEATGEKSALEIACKAAEMLVREFIIGGPDKTSGHEEIEIALLRLYQLTHHQEYLELAHQFLERRGKVRPFAALIIQQNARVARRQKKVNQQRASYLAGHPEERLFQLPASNFAKKSRFAKLRWLVNGLSGKYFQQHAPIRKQTIPVGHSVRFAYLETAIAMLCRVSGDASLEATLQKSWDRMVNRRMYITGGIGSLAENEGFGRDFELDPELAYAETCAALGSLFWNWEMALLLEEAKYSDLFEWQLYNAAAVGMGLGGDNYLYNNPLLCRGGVTRRAWFQVPCCPSNLSRTWASLGKYIYSHDEKNLYIHQYVGNQVEHEGGIWSVRMVSGLPWRGKILVTLDSVPAGPSTIHFRLPSWAGTISVLINNERIEIPAPIENDKANSEGTASGYDPRRASFLPIQRIWSTGDVVDVKFEMPITFRHASGRVGGHKGKVSMTRGPLVYCLESIDNAGFDIFNVKIIPGSVHVENAPALLGGIWLLRGLTSEGKQFAAIPYHLWANRGESRMTVWVNEQYLNS